jgi:hypothetical protein
MKGKYSNTKKENQLNKQRIIAQAQKRLDLVLKSVGAGKGIEIERTGMQRYHGISAPYNGDIDEYARNMQATLDLEAKSLRRGQGLKIKIRKF